MKGSLQNSKDGRKFDVGSRSGVERSDEFENEPHHFKVNENDMTKPKEIGEEELYFFKNEVEQNSCYIISVLQTYIFMSNLYSKEGLDILGDKELLKHSGTQSFKILRELLIEAKNRGNEGKNYALCLKAFRRVLAKEFSKNFPYGKPGDAYSFLCYLNNNMEELCESNETLLQDAGQHPNSKPSVYSAANTLKQSKVFDVKKVFNINYIATCVGDMSEMSLCLKRTNAFLIDMSMIVETIEKCVKGGVQMTCFKDKFIKLANVLLRTDKNCHKKFLMQVLKSNGQIFYTHEFRLVDDLPQYLTFTLNYKRFFDIYEDMENKFSTREFIAHILPEKFSLKEIFCGVPLNESISSFASLADRLTSYKNNVDSIECWLSCIVGFYGGHYMSFIKKKFWCRYDDDKYVGLVVGNFDDLLDFMREGKIIPYLVFYKVGPDQYCGGALSMIEEEKMASSNICMSKETHHKSFCNDGCYLNPHIETSEISTLDYDRPDSLRTSVSFITENKLKISEGAQEKILYNTGKQLKGKRKASKAEVPECEKPKYKLEEQHYVNFMNESFSVVDNVTYVKTGEEEKFLSSSEYHSEANSVNSLRSEMFEDHFDYNMDTKSEHDLKASMTSYKLTVNEQSLYQTKRRKEEKHYIYNSNLMNYMEKESKKVEAKPNASCTKFCI